MAILGHRPPQRSGASHAPRSRPWRRAPWPPRRRARPRRLDVAPRRLGDGEKHGEKMVKTSEKMRKNCEYPQIILFNGIFPYEPTIFGGYRGWFLCPNVSHHRTRKGVSFPTDICFGDVKQILKRGHLPTPGKHWKK